MSKRSSHSFPVGPAFFFSIASFLILAAIGWCMNIYKLATENPFIWDGETILRIVGIFLAPLGAIMGWFV